MKVEETRGESQMELETALFSREIDPRVSRVELVILLLHERVNFFDSLVTARVLSFNELTMPPVRLFSFLSFSIRLSVCVIDRRSYGY